MSPTATESAADGTTVRAVPIPTIPWCATPPIPCDRMVNRTAISSNEIHMWRLSESGSNLAPHGFLSADEEHRASLFRRPGDRVSYVRRHEALRCILAEYTGRPPAALRFTYGRFGRPELLDDKARGLSFNMSSRGGEVLIAVASVGPVGVDVERIGAITIDEHNHFLTRSEAEAITSLSGPDQSLALVTCWARKEALLKALGMGFLRPPEQIEVGWDQSSIVQLDGAGRFRVDSLAVGVGYIAAVAAPAGSWTIKVFDWAG